MLEEIVGETTPKQFQDLTEQKRLDILEETYKEVLGLIPRTPRFITDFLQGQYRPLREYTYIDVDYTLLDNIGKRMHLT